MYRAFLDDVCILDASLDITLDDTSLELADNTAGSFSFTIYHDNPGYELVKNGLITNVVTVYWNDEVLYKGRILNVEQDFYKGLTVTTEGELAYLDDTVQRPAEYHELTVRGYLEQIISLHNAKAGADKQFVVGAVTVTDSNDSLYRYTNWESTLTTLKDDLVSSLGGHLRIRHENGQRILDYLKDYPRVSNQKIEFGENLLSYTELTDATNVATVCIPLGARQDESEIEALEQRLTIETVNGGSDELRLDTAISRFGRITKTVIWDNVQTPEILKAKGRQWLQDNQYNELTLTLTAVDLADFGVEVDHLRLLDRIRCTSKPHGMDREFPLTEMKINLLDPSQNVYTLGAKTKSFSGMSSRATKSLQQAMGNQPSKSHVLKQALDNATALINMFGDDGHVMLTNNEIYVSDYDNIEDAQNIWRWNLGGLAHSSNGYQGPYDTAITMDGTIAGRFIAAGTIGADQISASYTSTQEQKWTDELNNEYWKKTEIETAISNSADSVTLSVQSWAGTNFYTKSQMDVTVSGIQSTVSQKVGSSEIGTLIEQSASHVKIAWNKISSVIQFENAQMNIYNGSNKIISFNPKGTEMFYSGYQVGRIGTNRWTGNTSMRGLTFDLDPDGAYMAWAARSTESQTDYTTVLVYTQKAYSNYSAGYLNLGADLDCHNRNIINGKFKGWHYSSDGSLGASYSGTLYIPVSVSGIAGGSYITVNLKDGVLT